MRDRFGATYRLDFYTDDELAAIVDRSAAILGVPIEPAASVAIARRGRGTPRIVNRLLKRVRDHAEVHGDGRVDEATAREAMRAMEIDDEGLDSTDRKLLAAIVQKFASGPVGVAALAAVLVRGGRDDRGRLRAVPAAARVPRPDAAGPHRDRAARAHLAGLGYEIPPPRRSSRDAGALGRPVAELTMEGSAPCGWALVVVGVIIGVIGLVFVTAGAIPLLGHLPGDIVIQRDNVTIFVPLGDAADSVVVSVVLGLLNRPECRRRTLRGRRAAAGGRSTRARLGRLTLTHGVVETPQFMPVGTNATVKALDPDDSREAGATIILANTYHLYLRPGHERIARLGGLHRFMAWDRPILTDSGGFQVVSLGDLRVVDDDGVTFRSHLDGSIHRFTPEHAIAGPGGARLRHRGRLRPAGLPDARRARSSPTRPRGRTAGRSARWPPTARPDQALFGIIQGGLEPDLRAESTRFIAALPFDGICIGGLAGDETPEQRDATLDVAVPLLADDPRPRYLMGLGSPADLLDAVDRGVDLFDSVLPARVARNGQLWVPGGRLNLRNPRFLDDPAPVQEGCPCLPAGASRGPTWPTCSGPTSCSPTASRLVTT